MASILPLFPIENVFIFLKEIFSEAGFGIILSPNGVVLPRLPHGWDL